VTAELIEIGMNSTAAIIGLFAEKGALVEAGRESETRSRWRRRRRRTSGVRTALCRWRLRVVIAGVTITITITLVVAIAAVIVGVPEVGDGSERREVIGDDDARIECEWR